MSIITHAYHAAVGRPGRGANVALNIGKVGSIDDIADDILERLVDDPDKDVPRKIARAAARELAERLDDLLVWSGPAGGIIEAVDGIVLRFLADAIVSIRIRSRKRERQAKAEATREFASVMLDGKVADVKKRLELLPPPAFPVLLAAEREGASRKGVLEALEALVGGE